MDHIDIVVDERGDYLDHAALIWAAVTAARDADSEPATLQQARPVILKVLSRSPLAFLLLAIVHENVVGFAALAPHLDEQQSAELVYLGVNPLYWQRNIGKKLLSALLPIAASKGFNRIYLNVYCDNMNAIRLYERQGWLRSGVPLENPRTKRLEQRFWIHTTA